MGTPALRACNCILIFSAGEFGQRQLSLGLGRDSCCSDLPRLCVVLRVVHPAGRTLIQCR